jgi:hypothetical protein
MRTWKAGYFSDGYLDFEPRRSHHANAQMMKNATPAPVSTSTTATFASTGSHHSQKIVRQTLHSTRGEPDWELPQ